MCLKVTLRLTAQPLPHWADGVASVWAEVVPEKTVSVTYGYTGYIEERFVELEKIPRHLSS